MDSLSGATAAGLVMPSVARKPEFSQCFGDKAALEELTDGASMLNLSIHTPIHTFESRFGRRRHLNPPDPSPSFLASTTADLLTAIEFDQDGEYLATGDKGGRVVIFQKGDDIKQVCFTARVIGRSMHSKSVPFCSCNRSPSPPLPQVTPEGRRKWACKYRFYSEFQSHEPEFDYLKSLEIEEKINQIKWCRRTGGAHFLLSSNGGCAPGFGLVVCGGWGRPFVPWSINHD